MGTTNAGWNEYPSLPDDASDADKLAAIREAFKIFDERGNDETYLLEAIERYAG